MCEILSGANIGTLIRLHGKIKGAMYKNIIEHFFFSESISRLGILC